MVLATVPITFAEGRGANFIFINNPEYITKYDIVDGENEPIPGGENKTYPIKKIFEQAVSGTNTYYQTHISWFNNPEGHETDYPDERGFYVDVDFITPVQRHG